MTGGKPAAADVEAIVVTWNTSELMVQCVESLLANPPTRHTFEITVVDNGSDEGEAAIVARRWPDIRVIRSERNEGFTRANNRAIRQSQARYLLLINADARLLPGCVDVMLARMELDPRCGAVGPRLEYGDGRFQRWTAGRAPGLGSALSYYLLLDRIPGLEHTGLFLGRDVNRPFQAGWVSSACMLIRREALNQVGLLDEQIFTYMDDVDICRRLWDGGWTVWYSPDAKAVHLMGQSVVLQTGNVSPRAVRSFHAYFGRHHGGAASAALRAIEVLGFGLRAVAYRTALVFRREPRLRAQARAHWTYLKVALERTTDG